MTKVTISKIQLKISKITSLYSDKDDQRNPFNNLVKISYLTSLNGESLISQATR